MAGDSGGGERGAPPSRRVPIESGTHLAGRLARTVAHEVNSPLTLVLTNLGCLKDDLEEGTLGPEQVSELRELVEEAEEASRRVALLLKTYRAVARPMSEALSRVDVNASVTRALELVRRELETWARIDVRLGQPPLVAVRGGLLHAWTHLFVAVSEVLASGPVRIETHAVASEALLTVSFQASGWPGPLEPGLFAETITSAGGRYEIGLDEGRARVDVYLPADHPGSPDAV